MKKQTLIIIALGISLFLLAGFIILDKWSESLQDSLLQAYTDGYEKGFIDTIEKLLEQTEDCQITPIWVENKTRKLVDVDCINITTSDISP